MTVATAAGILAGLAAFSVAVVIGQLLWERINCGLRGKRRDHRVVIVPETGDVFVEVPISCDPERPRTFKSDQEWKSFEEGED